MSNERLSELSKPVAQAYYDEHDSSTMLIDWLVDSVPEAPAALYSQEYVSALLADSEAKDKRIADMEHVVAAAKCDDELWDAMAHRLKTLEAKLATPVRLPETYSPDPWMGPDPDGTWLDKEDVKKSIRDAGFTVEGDE